MSKIATSSRRSRIAQATSNASGARGFHKNPGDFSDLVGTKAATRQEFLRKHWDYLPPAKLARAESLSTTFRGVAIDTSTGQFGLGL